MNLIVPSQTGNRASRSLMFCFVLGYSSAPCFAESVPVPPSGVDGPTWSAIPFDFRPVPPVTSSRYQQVYRASAFSSIGEGGGWITGLYWVSEPASSQAWGTTLPSTEISLSVTSLEPDHLSTNFAANVGTNVTIVFSRGSLVLDGGSGGVAVDVKFSTPFFYNPSSGNLLLEIKNYEPTCCFGIPQQSVGALDAYNVAGDEISRIYAYDVDADTGFADTLGLTTYIVFAPKLVVTLQFGSVVIRWPSDIGQFRIQQTAVLGPGALWEPADGTYTGAGGIVTFILPQVSGGSSRFFRLIATPSSPTTVGGQTGAGTIFIPDQNP